MSNEFTKASLIHSYTRADALQDGVLLELPRAMALGFRVPVAITGAAYSDCIAWSRSDPKLPSILRLREEMVLLAALAEAKALRRRQQADTRSRE